MELNSGYLKLSDAEKTDRFTRLANRQVRYLISPDELGAEYPPPSEVLAYIILYERDGFVIVAGDDRIEPILAFSANSKFQWDPPADNFMRCYLHRALPVLWENMPAQVHANWSLLRRKITENRQTVTYDNLARAVYVLWHTAEWNQMDNYNDTCEAHNGNHDVPTGCVATAMAIKMRFHLWPNTGNGSHSYDDTKGWIQYSHNVNFGNQTYNWQSMPDTNVTEPNAEVARIMYHCGVAVDMDYELNGSGTNTLLAASALNNYFRYRGTTQLHNDTIARHEAGMMTSIIGMLPVQIGYWWIDGNDTVGHSVLTDGYRDDNANHWHINCGWNGVNNGWYALDILPPGTGLIYKSCPYGQPNNWIYIDKNWTGFEYGLIRLPYNTLQEGEAASINGGRLMVKTGTYTGSENVPITFDNAVAITAFAGDVVVGQNLWLKNYESIRLQGNGQLKIIPAKMGK